MILTKKDVEMMTDKEGDLDLRGTAITALPDNLTVGGWLDLRGTAITTLPDNLTVGGWFDLRGTAINNKNFKKLKDGDYVPGRYIYADGILTHVKKEKRMGPYTLYVGKIKNRHVITDGSFFAHCSTMRDGISDLTFKHASNRGADQYKDLTMDSIVSFDTAKTMYRVITGACQAGTEQFIHNLKEIQPEYTIKELIDLTRGQYNADSFANFFTA